MSVLNGRRVVLRPLGIADFAAYQEVRRRNVEWLTKWEPRRLPSQPDPAESFDAFAARCSARQRERQLGTVFGFGIFVDGALSGEINLSAVQRGPMQGGSIGYWVDEAQAGNGYCPEAVVTMLRFAFEDLALHRLQICIVPRNGPSRRVVEKLGIRCEGVAVGLLQINGEWEDHMQFAMVAEDWALRGPELLRTWIL
ncbi:MAG: GNAT family N-acetyltransferase [Acidimicrobiia bacterium]